ncbi:MAG: DNA polymerase/3'-5' exonuclease PolX [Candidatus Eisenbacteria bacterium]|nr:DNA polymerase/3'-5' exonuclease PolX [Candidatus Eisenbacteria bacterium]
MTADVALSNADIARVFSRMAVMLELDQANPFRVRAYREGARVIETLVEPLTALAPVEGELEKLKGIGKDLAQKIRDLVASGTTRTYDELLKKYPLEMIELTELQGLGPKRVRQLRDELGIGDRASLEAAAREGKLRDLPGFGEKLEAKVLQSLSVAAEVSGRVLLAGAWPLATEIADAMRRVPGVRRVELAGSFRRRRETVGDLDVLVAGGRSAGVMDAFTKHARVIEVLGRGETKSSVRLASGLQVDLRHVPEASFGAALLYFTGSKAHNIELRKIAIENGMSLNEYGLTRGERTVASRTEEDIYRALSLDWIPPELREAQGEIELAREGRLPRLIEESDLCGDLHMHTDRSDGRHSLEQMVRAAKERGYAYCAITEHSKSLGMAGGFNEERVLRSVDEIAAVRRKVPGIEVLHGLEVDILADGTLDLEDDALKRLDWVIVSLHSRLDQPGPEVTKRVLRALEHPSVCAMAHPTGRLIGSRNGAALDFEAVFSRAAELGVAMEINSQPDRTDLSDVNARFALEKGVTLVIDTDAHAMNHLELIRFGVFAARRAGVTKKNVLNARPLAKLKDAVRHRGASLAPSEPRLAKRAKTAPRDTAPARRGAVPAPRCTATARRGAAARRGTPARRRRAP